MNKLVLVDETLQERTHLLRVERTTVGSAEGNVLRLHHDSISPRHCEILVFGAEVIVRDLGSKVGTVVNGERLINEQRQLKAGQIVQFGLVRARLELDEPQRGDVAATAIYDLAAFKRAEHAAVEGTTVKTLDNVNHPAPLDSPARTRAIAPQSFAVAALIVILILLLLSLALPE
jgi:pSer/pThr/pTyr-binding forkhead associated (FHA) protein